MFQEVGLVKKNIKSLTGKDWYNQRFDGCLNLIWMISEAELTKERRKIGADFKLHICTFSDNKVDWFIDERDMRRVTNIFLNLCQSTKYKGKDIISAWKKDEASFFKFLPSLDGIDLSSLDLTSLVRLYKDFSAVYLRTITSSSLIDGFALGSDEII